MSPMRKERWSLEIKRRTVKGEELNRRRRGGMEGVVVAVTRASRDNAHAKSR